MCSPPNRSSILANVGDPKRMKLTLSFVSSGTPVSPSHCSGDASAQALKTLPPLTSPCAGGGLRCSAATAVLMVH